MDKVKLLQSDQLTEKQKMLLYFFIYAFLGWILETIYCVVTLGIFNKRGFLYGPNIWLWSSFTNTVFKKY